MIITFKLSRHSSSQSSTMKTTGNLYKEIELVGEGSIKHINLHTLVYSSIHTPLNSGGKQHLTGSGSTK